MEQAFFQNHHEKEWGATTAFLPLVGYDILFDLLHTPEFFALQHVSRMGPLCYMFDAFRHVTMYESSLRRLLIMSRWIHSLQTQHTFLPLDTIIMELAALASNLGEESWLFSSYSASLASSTLKENRAISVLETILRREDHIRRHLQEHFGFSIDTHLAEVKRVLCGTCIEHPLGTLFCNNKNGIDVKRLELFSFCSDFWRSPAFTWDGPTIDALIQTSIFTPLTPHEYTIAFHASTAVLIYRFFNCFDAYINTVQLHPMVHSAHLMRRCLTQVFNNQAHGCGDYDRNIRGDFDQNVSGDYDRNVSGDYDRNVRGDYDQNVRGDYNVHACAELRRRLESGDLFEMVDEVSLVGTTSREDIQTIELKLITQYLTARPKLSLSDLISSTTVFLEKTLCSSFSQNVYLWSNQENIFTLTKFDVQIPFYNRIGVTRLFCTKSRAGTQHSSSDSSDVFEDLELDDFL